VTCAGAGGGRRNGERERIGDSASSGGETRDPTSATTGPIKATEIDSSAYRRREHGCQIL